MANVQKYARTSITGLAIHIERKTDNHSNENIKIERKNLNYSFLNDDSDMLSRLNKRLEEVYYFNRKDLKVCCSWVVTLPKEYFDYSSGNQRDFFEKTFEFLRDEYGAENVIAAEVHNDERTPHLHFSFVPVVDDTKHNQGKKVSAKEVLTRNHLRTFHKRLDEHLKKHLVFYEGGVLNGTTDVNIKNVEGYKKLMAELESKEKEFNAGLVERENELNKKSKNLDEYIQERKAFTDISIELDVENATKDLEREMHQKRTEFDAELKKEKAAAEIELSREFDEKRRVFDIDLLKEKANAYTKLDEELAEKRRVLDTDLLKEKANEKSKIIEELNKELREEFTVKRRINHKSIENAKKEKQKEIDDAILKYKQKSESKLAEEIELKRIEMIAQLERDELTNLKNKKLLLEEQNDQLQAQIDLHNDDLEKLKHIDKRIKTNEAYLNKTDDAVKEKLLRDKFKDEVNYFIKGRYNEDFDENYLEDSIAFRDYSEDLRDNIKIGLGNKVKIDYDYFNDLVKSSVDLVTAVRHMHDYKARNFSYGFQNHELNDRNRELEKFKRDNTNIVKRHQQLEKEYRNVLSDNERLKGVQAHYERFIAHDAVKGLYEAYEAQIQRKNVRPVLSNQLVEREKDDGLSL